MWQFHFVPRYGDGSAWVMRVHHCYADGIAMVRVLLSMTEQDPAPALAPRARPGRRTAAPRVGSDVLKALDWVEQLAQPAGDIVENALAEGAKLLEGGIHHLFHPDRIGAIAAQASGMAGEFARVLTLPDDPDTPLRGVPGGDKAVAWGAPIPLHEVRTIGRALGCTINDVLMSTVAGALGGHLRAQGCDTAGLQVRASVPVNLRAVDEPLSLGNRFGLVFVDLALGLPDPLQRLAAMRDTMAALKGSIQPPMSLMTLGLMGLLPAAMQAPVVDLFSRKATAVVSNVPGPQAPLYLCGQRVSEMHFWVPQSGSIGLGISILSYAGQVHFGMISDRRVLDAPGGVVERFAPEFEKLLLAATVGVLASRPPSPQGRKARRKVAQKKAAKRLREVPSPRIDTVQQSSRIRPQ
jgi:WS/DGAT/MGAT family acyltransferase